MKQTVTGDMFVQAFQQIRPNNFSLEGLHLLYTGLESLESDLGNDIELDVIAICCDYTESTPAEVIEMYGLEKSSTKYEVMDYLTYHSPHFCGETPSGTLVFLTF